MKMLFFSKGLRTAIGVTEGIFLDLNLYGTKYKVILEANQLKVIFI